MKRSHFIKSLPVLISVVASLIVMPLTLLAVKTNQDIRSEAMLKKPPLPTLAPRLELPTPSPSTIPSPKPRR